MPHARAAAPAPQSRRDFLIKLFMGAGIAATGPLLNACSSGGGGGATIPSSTLGTIGPLGEPDGNGIRLPAGFSSRIVARSGVPILGDILGGLLPPLYTWHTFPDGGATFAADDGGWVYVSNSESVPGGVGALRFDAQGNIIDAYSICTGTITNCAGGPTPWGTWLTCEEVDNGRVVECAPFGRARDAQERRALGIFKHEAAAVDPAGKAVYMTEDDSDGRLYRFACSELDWPADAARPGLEDGELQVARLRDFDYETAMPGIRWGVEWVAVADPTAKQNSQRRPEDTRFRRGEGMWFTNGIVYFTTTSDKRLWAYDTVGGTVEIVYDTVLGGLDPVINGPDNITTTGAGDVLIAEDNEQASRIVIVTPDGAVLPLLQLIGQDRSEITGPAFSPDGTRLYFSSQRGGPLSGGLTYEITGPFNG
ncbi:MAG: PhoX family protein [Gammaproteobacteria bacterium]|nr:PhoX family protein [Gammaproteobacteria bacterium]